MLLVYLEAIVWVSTMLYLMADLSHHVWAAFVASSGWIILAALGLYYTQVSSSAPRHLSRSCIPGASRALNIYLYICI